MKKQLPPEKLEQLLRDGAADRRATLETLAPAYPVGDYPAKPAGRPTQSSGPGLFVRLAWLIGMGGLTTAGLLGLVTLVSLLVTPDPTQPSAPILAARPQPDTLGTNVQALVAGLGQLETRMDQQISPALGSATAWPTRLSTLPVVLNDAQIGLQEPLTQEFTALRSDLQTAMDYVRQQWRVEEPGSPTGGVERPGEALLAG